MSDADSRQRRRSETTDSEELGEKDANDDEQLGSKTCDGGENDGQIIVAIPDMCHHCFDALLKELLPKSSPSSKRSQTVTRKGTDDDDGGCDTLETNYDDVRGRLENYRQIYTPPAVECPLFVTWSKLRPSSHNNRPPTSSGKAASSSGGVATPASTTASSTNATDDNDTSPPSSSSYTHRDDSEYDLRGCIGTLSPKSLDRALSEFAITSALHDRRFDPISLREVPSLRVGVSLLVNYEECIDCTDWIVGVHGIIIEFECGGDNGDYIGAGCSSSGRTYGATYLPEVAHEQRWSQRETVASLVRKAGYRGTISDGLLARVRCTRYRSSKYGLSYREYALARHHDGGADMMLRGAKDAMTTAAAVEEVMMRGAKSSRTCVNL